MVGLTSGKHREVGLRTVEDVLYSVFGSNLGYTRQVALIEHHTFRHRMINAYKFLLLVFNFDFGFLLQKAIQESRVRHEYKGKALRRISIF
jgi:hypothetical protein